MKRTATFYSLTHCQPEVSEASAVKRRRGRTVSPSESVIRNILNYSKALTVLKTTEAGYINLVMN